MENKENLRHCQRPEQTDEKDNQIQNGTRDWILEQNEDINGKIGEIQIKSGVNKNKMKQNKTSAQQRKPSTKQKDNLLTGRKYVQMMQWTRSYYPKCANSSYNSISKKQTTQLKNGQNT